LIATVADMIGMEDNFVDIKSATLDTNTGAISVVVQCTVFLDDFDTVDTLEELFALISKTMYAKVESGTSLFSSPYSGSHFFLSSIGEFIASLTTSSPVGSFTSTVATSNVAVSESFLQLSEMTPAPSALPTVTPTAAPSVSCAADLVSAEQSMEEKLEFVPGATAAVGYHLTDLKGQTITVKDASITLKYACFHTGNAALAGQIVVPIPDGTYSGTGPQPAGSETAPAVWQVPSVSMATATAACNGGTVWLNKHVGGASFKGSFYTPNGYTQDVKFQFHYRRTSPNPSGGGWSDTSALLTCKLPPTNLRKL
jgi:hypothetical protein